LPVLAFFWFCCFLPVARPVWSAGSDDKAVPVVADLLLGGWLNGSWVDADTIASHVPAGKLYHAYGFDGPLFDLTGEAPKHESEGCEYWDISFGDGITAGESMLAVGSTTPGMPRRPRLQTGGLKPYEELVASYLKKNKISADPEIRQLVRVDLDGDGSEEVFVVAGNADASIPVFVKDTYSLVLFRRIVDGKVVTSVLREHYYDEDIEGEADSPNAYTFVFAVDINGDGVLEILLKGRYYEGFWYEIHEFKNGELKKVLSDGLGA
jgi:hypothetical protein